MELGFQFPGLQLRVDAFSRSGHDDNADARLVQKRDVPHEHGEQGMVHEAVVNLQDEKLALEPVHVAEHFPDEAGDFEVLGIEIGRRVVHIQKDKKTKDERKKTKEKNSPK